jgi:hypothetical protein
VRGRGVVSGKRRRFLPGRRAFPGENRIARAAKELGKAILPAPFVRRIQGVMGAWGRRRLIRTVRPIDLSRVQLIRDAPLDRLRDASYLEHDLLLRLGLNGEQLYTLPDFLHPYAGRGLLHWQYPNQFGKYLVELSRHRIASYLELGVRHGGTFVITVEYLDRFYPVERAVGIDLGLTATLRGYASSRPGVTVLQADSQSDEFRDFVRAGDPFDLVLIDADHSEDGVRSDFETVREHARIIVFHDIVSEQVPGVAKVWSEVREKHADRFDFLEFTDQYPDLRAKAEIDYLGLGVAITRSWGADQPDARTGAEARPALPSRL